MSVLAYVLDRDSQWLLMVSADGIRPPRQSGRSSSGLRQVEVREWWWSRMRLSLGPKIYHRDIVWRYRSVCDVLCHQSVSSLIGQLAVPADSYTHRWLRVPRVIWCHACCSCKSTILYYVFSCSPGSGKKSVKCRGKGVVVWSIKPLGLNLYRPVNIRGINIRFRDILGMVAVDLVENT